MTASESSDNAREYSERFYDFKKMYGGYPLVEGSFVSQDVWNIWQSKAFELMRADLESGWEVDPSAWGAYCIKYEKKRINLLSRSGGAWIIYIIFSVVSYGIGFFIIPFFMYRDFIELKGIDVRLMRKRN